VDIFSKGASLQGGKRLRDRAECKENVQQTFLAKEPVCREGRD